MTRVVFAAILASYTDFGGPSVALMGSDPPAPYLTVLTSNPATECAGADITTDQGGTITVSRNLAAYCTRAVDGVLVSVGVNKPRVNNNGILVEGQRTNLVPRSEELDHSDWTKSDVTVEADIDTDPAGGSTVDELSMDGVAGGHIESKAFVPNQTTMTVSMWFHGSDTADFDVVIRDTTAGVDRATCDYDPASIPIGTRIICNASGLTGGNNHVVRIYPAGTAGSTGVAYVWGVQAEALLQNFVTSYIPTTNAAVTRPNDVITISNGTDISAKGCISASVTFLNPTISSTAGLVSNGTERMMGYTNATAMQINDGTNTVSAAVSSVLGRTINIRTKWSGSSMTITADGVTSSGTFDGSFSSTATLRIGATAAGAGYAYAYIDNIKFGSHPDSCD